MHQGWRKSFDELAGIDLMPAAYDAAKRVMEYVYYWCPTNPPESIVTLNSREPPIGVSIYWPGGGNVNACAEYCVGPDPVVSKCGPKKAAEQVARNIVGEDACLHDKEYDGHVLPTAPPQYPWTCRKCGFEGKDRG